MKEPHLACVVGHITQQRGRHVHEQQRREAERVTRGGERTRRKEQGVSFCCCCCCGGGGECLSGSAMEAKEKFSSAEECAPVEPQVTTPQQRAANLGGRGTPQGRSRQTRWRTG